MATSFTTHSAAQVIASADINLIQTAVNTLENAGSGAPTQAALSGFLGWSHDPAMSSQDANPTAGTVYVSGVYLPAGTVTNLHTYVDAGAATTHLAMGLYSSAGALLSQTADQTSAGSSTGLKTWALGTPQVVTAGYYYIGLGLTGTPPSVLTCALQIAAVVNAKAGSPALAFRGATSPTAYATTLPSTLGALVSSLRLFWVAAS